MLPRTETIILAILEVFGLFGVFYGIWFQYANNLSLVGIFYCSVWYILRATSYILGLASIVVEIMEEDDETAAGSQTLLEYHYLLAWLSLVIGYPLLVTYTWTLLNPTILAQLHLLLAIIPVIAFIGRTKDGIIRTTQICTGITAVSHFVLCYSVGDVWGWTGAVVMFINNIILSTPTRYHIWIFNSRELLIIGLLTATFLSNNSIIMLSSN